MCPKQRWPPKAWISTARALFDSPMYGASIWLVSPVKITLVPSPMRVSTVFSVVGSRFWASSTTTIWRCSERPRRNVTDSSDSWLRPISSSINRVGVVAAALIGEGDDRIVDRRHPRVELLVERAGQEADVGATDRDQRAVDGEALVAAALDDLLEAGGDGQQRLAGAGATVEGDDADVGIEQQLEREALLLRAGPQAPRLGCVVVQQHRGRRRHGAPAPTASRRAARRTRSRGAGCTTEPSRSSIALAAYRQSIASCAASYVPHPLGRVDMLRPTGRCSSACRPRWAALMRSAASLDTTHVGAVHLLAERGADDPVVGHATGRGRARSAGASARR